MVGIATTLSDPYGYVPAPCSAEVCYNCAASAVDQMKPINLIWKMNCSLGNELTIRTQHKRFIPFDLLMESQRKYSPRGMRQSPFEDIWWTARRQTERGVLERSLENHVVTVNRLLVTSWDFEFFSSSTIQMDIVIYNACIILGSRDFG